MKIKTLFKYYENPEAEFSKFGWEKFSFSLEEVESINPSDDGLTTLNFKSGSRIEVAIKYDDFEEVFNGSNFKEIFDSKIKFEYES